MEWQTYPGLLDYETALARMAERVEGIQRGALGELAWMVEHPPLYTLGTSARESDVLDTPSLSGKQYAIPAYRSGRGGQVTYHGPGQRIVYVMRDLKRHVRPGTAGPDLRAYVQDLERWIILTLATFGVEGFVREGRIGVWVAAPRGEAKIAALGVRVQRWVTSHGIALNVDPDLSHYAGIVPCGIRAFGVTSLAALGITASMEEVDRALQENFARVFGE